MTDHKDLPPDFRDLRRRAEERIAAEAIPPEELTPDQAARLIHELRVHQIELEMQNDELRRSQALLEESRTQYADLYDFAPVGYLTLDIWGKIVEANLTAATLLGVERSRLVNRFFSHFLVEADRRVFRQLMNNGQNQTERRGEVHLQDGGGNVRVMLLDILFLTDAEGQDHRRVSLTDITELKRTQEELRLHKEELEELVAQRTAELIEVNEQLREANENLEALFAATPLAIAAFDADGKVTNLNLAAELLYGWTREEVQGRLPLTIPQESPEESLALLQRVLGGESVTGVEIKQQCKDGTILDVSVSAAPLHDAGGKLRGFVALGEDITARKKLEEDVRTQARVLENMAEGVTVTDQRGQIIYTNPAFDAMFGYEAGELAGRHSNVLNFYPPEESLGMVKEILDQVNATGLWTGEFRNCRKDGKPFSTLARISSLTADGKKLYISVQEDITQRKRAQEMLQRQAELLDLAHDAILVRDPRGRITYWNQGAAHHYGWTREEALGEISHKLLQTVFPQPLKEIEGLLLEHGFWEGELTQTTQQGGKLVMNSRWTAKRDETGRVVAILEIGQDVTVQKQIEAEVHRLASFPLLSPIPILEVDENGHILYANPAARHAAEKLRLRGGMKAFLPPDLKKLLAAARKGGPRQHDFDLPLKDRMYAVTVFFPHDLPPARVYALDITERHRAEAALRNSERRFRKLVEANVVGIVVSDEEKILEANDEFLRLVGYTREEMQAGKIKWVEMTPREYIPDDARALYELRNTGAHTPFEKTFVRQDGSRVPVVVGGALLEEEPLLWVSFVLDITERKQLEDSLRLSELRFRAIFANAGIGIATTDLAGRLQEFNAPVMRGLGYTPTELKGMNFLDVTHPDDLAADKDLFTELAAGQRDHYQVEKRYIRKDGRVLWGRLHASLVRGPGGEPQFAVTLVEDITARKESQAALEDSEARYRSLVDLSPDAILVHAQGRYVFVNPAGLRLFGAASPEDIIGRRVLELVHPDSQETVKRRVNTGERLDLREVKILRLDGQAMEVEVSATPIRYQGQPAVQVVVRDITERKAAEEALRASEDRFRKIFENAPMGIAITDMQGRFQQVNPSHCAILGYTEEELRGVHYSTVIHPEDWDANEREIQRLKAGELSFFEVENRYVNKDGQPVWVHKFVSTLTDAGGQPAHLVALATNITVRRQAEEALRASEARERARAAELQAILDTYPGIILLAHDPEGRVITGNRAAYEILRRTPGSNLSKSAGEGEKPENFRVMRDGREVPGTELPVQRTAATGEAVRDYEVALVFDDGSVRHILGDAVPLLDEEGRPRGAVAAFLDFTERKQAEEALARKQAEFEAIFNSISDGVFFADTERRIVLANPAAETHFGYSLEEMQGRTTEFLYASPEDYEEQGRLRYHTQTDQTQTSYEITYRRKDGSPFPAEVRGGQVRDAQGRVLGYVSIHRDITIRKAAEEALRDSEARERARATELQAVLDAVPTPIFLCHDPDGRFITGNPAAYELLGQPPGSNLSKAAPEDELPDFRPLKDGRELAVSELPMQRARSGQTVRHLEYNLLLADGTVRHISANAAPLLDDAGRPRGAVGAFMDLTERQRMEEALRQALDHFQTLFDTSPLPILTTDFHGLITSWNPAAERLFGWRAEEVIGRSLPTVPEGEREELAELYHQEQEGRFFLGKELRRQTREGSLVDVSLFSAPLRDAQGNVTGFMGILEDITARKRTETALRESREDLNRAQAVAHTGSWRLNVQKNELTWSDETHRIFGIPRGTPLTYEVFLAVVHPEDREYVDQSWTAALEGDPYDIEHRIVVDGTVKWLRELAELEFDSRGQLLGGFGTVQDVTAPKAAEEALIQAKEEWERTFDAVPDFIAILDNEHRVTRVNKAMKELLGKPSNEVIGLPCYKAVHGLDEAPDFCPHVQVVSTGQAHSAEVREFGRVFAVSVSPVTTPDGQIIGGVHVARDITEMKRAEEALRESEERYRSLFENNHAVMLLLDPDTGAIVDANPAAAAYYGYSREDLLALPITNINTLDPEQVKEVMQQAREGSRKHFEFKHRLATGELKDVEVSSGPIRIKGRELLYSIVHDITARKQAENDVRESESRFRSLFENMTEGVALHEIIYDDQGAAQDYRILATNPAFTVHTGMAAEQVRGRLASEAYGTEEAPYLETYARVAHIGEPETFETYFAPLQRHFSVSATSPKPGHFVTVFEDIAARKRMEEDLRRSNQRLDLLADTAGRLLVAATPQKVVDSLCRKVMDFLDCDVFINYLVMKNDPQLLRLNAYAGLTSKEAQPLSYLEFGVAVCGSVAREARRIVCEDIQNTEDPRTELVKSFGVQAFACHPLMVGGWVLGTLAFGSRKKTSFSSDDLALMKAVADQVAIALDRKLAEEALRESEARYRAIGELIPFGIWTAAPDGGWDYVSKSFLEMTGKTLAECQGSSWMNLLPYEDIKPTLKAWQDSLETGGFWDHEYKVRGRDGSWHTVLSRGLPLADPQGRITSWVGINLDISTRKEMEEALRRAHDELEVRVEERTAALSRAHEQLLLEFVERQKIEDQLRESEARFTSFMEHLPGLAVMRDMEGHYLFANRAWEESIGLEPGAWQGMTLTELWEPERAAALQQLDFQVISSGKPIEQVEVQVLAEGPHHFLTTRFPIRDAEGLPYMVGAIAIDVTDRQRAEQQVAETGRLYRVLSRVNEAIMRGRDQEALFNQVCRIVVEEGLFRMAWVGLTDPDDQKIRVAAKYGFDEGYLDNLAISLGDGAKGQGPTGTAIREDRYDICNDFDRDPRMAPWREQALARGYRSSGAFPLHVGGKVVGALTLYAYRPEFFTDKEISLLTTLAENLSFALESLDRETKRRQAEEALAAERQRFLDLLEHLPAFVYLQAPDYTMRFANREFRQRFGEANGATCYSLLWGREEPCPECPTFTVFHTGMPREWEWTAPDGRVYQVYDYPFADADGSPLVLEMGIDITERKRAEEALAEQAMLVQDLYNKAPCGYHSLDSEGYLAQINDTELAWLGYDRSEVVGRLHFTDILTPDSRKIFEHTFPEFKARGWVRDVEYELVRKDGSVFPVNLSATAITDEAGNYLMSRSSLFDITDRKRAEVALAMERQRLFALMEQIPAYVALLAPDYTVPYANREFVRRFGEAKEGQTCYDFLFGTKEPCPDCRTFKVLETNQPQDWEWLGPDGRTYAIYDYPFIDADGSPLILEMGLDITDRKRVEEALKQNEAMLRLILETLPVGVWVTDREGRIVEGNPAARRIWGGARYVGVEEYGEYQGWWADTGKKIEADEWALARAIQKGETSLGEVINIQCFDGSRKTIINSGVPLFGEKREILGAIVVNQDITEMVRAEEVIREQGRQLEAFFAHSLTPVVFLDRDFNFLRVNEAYARAGQRTTQDFIGHNHFEFYPDAENQAIFAEVVRSKTPYQIQAKPFEFPDHPEWGVTYWDWSLVPILDQAGEVDFLVFSLRDVTRRVLSEQARNRLIEILEATPDFVGIADFYGHLQYLNRAGRAMVGVGEDEDVTSLRVLDLHPAEVGRLILEKGSPTAIKEGAWQAELALFHRDGREIPVSQVILAHKDPAGRVQFFSTVARDISDMKEAQASILRQTTILNGINRIFRETLTCETATELGQSCLSIAETLTNSQFGFITELNQQDRLDALALSDPNWQFCGLQPTRDLSHVKDLEPSGLLARPLKEGEAVIANAPASQPDWTGTLVNDSPLTSYLGMPLTYGGKTLGLLGLVNKEGGYIQTDREAVESLAPAIVEALMHHRAEQALKDSERKLRYLADQLLTAQEIERKRLAAELHDELGHALLALKLHLSSIEKKLPPEQEDVKEEIRGQLDYIHDVIQDVRRLYHDLSPGDVEDLGLTKALRTLINDFASHLPKITWQVELASLEGLFSLPVQTTIYRIVQEALTNIGKHANPSAVTISATKENQQVHFVVQDNGAGFDVAQKLGSGGSGRGVGLVAMEERLNMVGGSFAIQSREREGTTLSFTIPAIPEGERP